MSMAQDCKQMQSVRGNEARLYDQFFTKQDVANDCVNLLKDALSMNIKDFDVILEPSFGSGAFISALKLADVDMESSNLLFVDVDACDPNHRADFLNDTVVPLTFFHAYENGRDPNDKFLGKRKDGEINGKQRSLCLTIGNPPFGRKSSLAVAFFNKSAQFSAVIAFIVPKTFMKISIQDRLDRHFVLLKESELKDDAFLFKNESYNVPCVFQIWINTKYLDISKVPLCYSSLRPLSVRLTETPDFVFVSPLDNPDIAIRRVGVNAGRLFFDNPQQCSKQSHLFLKTKDKPRLSTVKNALQTLDLENVSVKYETAGCPSISKSELCRLYMEAHCSI